VVRFSLSSTLFLFSHFLPVQLLYDCILRRLGAYPNYSCSLTLPTNSQLILKTCGYRYVSTNLPVSRGQLCTDVDASIELLIGSHNAYEFAFYENPKMTIPEIYHVQVFWRKLPRAKSSTAKCPA
jgi:hypothetical protein